MATSLSQNYDCKDATRTLPTLLNLDNNLINIDEVLSIVPLNKKNLKGGVMIRFKSDHSKEGTYYDIPYEKIEEALYQYCRPSGKDFLYKNRVLDIG